MSKLRLLWLSHTLPYPPKGGSVQRSFNLIRELSRRFELCLFAFDDTPPHDTGQSEYHRALQKICPHTDIRPVPYPGGAGRTITLLRNLLHSAPYSVDLLRSKDMEQSLTRFCQANPVDVLHVDAIEAAPLADRVPCRLKVLNHQNAEALLLERRARAMPQLPPRWYVMHQARKLARYESRILPRFDINVAVSEEDRGVLRHAAPAARIELVPNGVDVDYFTPTGGEPVPDRVVYVGGLTWYPNYDAVQHFLREIWPLIRERLPQATCEIVGRIPPGRALGALPTGVKCTGFVDDVRPHLAQAQALVVPLRVGGGTRLKILDAMASGKAVVSTTIGCEGLGLEPETEILKGDTPDQFALQVARVCRDADLRRRLELAGRKRVEAQYAWSLIGQAYSQLLQQELERRT